MHDVCEMITSIDRTSALATHPDATQLDLPCRESEPETGLEQTDEVLRFQFRTASPSSEIT